MPCFIVVLALLEWSETEFAVSERNTCTTRNNIH